MIISLSRIPNILHDNQTYEIEITPITIMPCGNWRKCGNSIPRKIFQGWRLIHDMKFSAISCAQCATISIIFTNLSLVIVQMCTTFTVEVDRLGNKHSSYQLANSSWPWWVCLNSTLQDTSHKLVKIYVTLNILSQSNWD